MPSVAELDQRFLAVNPRARLVLGLGACAAMWIVAAGALATSLTSPMIGFDSGDSDTGDTVGVVALVLAALLFLGGGPAAYALSRRRWTMVLPVTALAVWGVGFVVAYLT